MKNNNKDSTEIKKTIKDSEVIQNLLNTAINLAKLSETIAWTTLVDNVTLELWR